MKRPSRVIFLLTFNSIYNEKNIQKSLSFPIAITEVLD
ncbi:hypothetical protein Cs308_0328 [Candidatus Chlamydia sanziniae]|uniref:Uncharacterized protein n=1 Tax=Candidatus Chlamydia sanziniae TaxID=1806891 RepID=A0A1A9HU35_9CHLA|nr:hypothetical protein Cs308_0328 [Candidatus Chlamydia sanziniae]